MVGKRFLDCWKFAKEFLLANGIAARGSERFFVRAPREPSDKVANCGFNRLQRQNIDEESAV
jgi:hypothetical protein